MSRLSAWEATEGQGVLSTADASRLQHIPLSKKKQKNIQSQHPKSHRIHCNYSSQFTFGMPLSIVIKTWKRQVCILLAETLNSCSAFTLHLHGQTHRTDMHTHSLFLCLACMQAHTHMHTAVWMWVGSHRDVNRLQIHTGPGLIHWSIFCSAGFKWS